MIQDVQVIPLTAHMDDRGYLVEIVRQAGGEEPHAVVHRFGQVYLVGDMVRGIIRAFHKHHELWDWFFISHGSAKFVLRDDRADSPTYGEMMTIIAGERNPRLIVVPPGVYHGWMSLEDDTQMISTASHSYNRANPDEVRIPPDAFGDVWTVKGK
ncbi:MAG: dTDP-4-dehydrorhamnose 3,5-epimerase family protein [Chloroflexi bacterium]|nr:dTDP-4-dehydrorhamnose 3,5-epimerase family protein [Chloroflexota bacterium]MBU1750010.1 dTDP-4-dehydrorhamnose 3,5-epimerase family protein [Chloroflexota bacterium]